jgi:hypothetical protein
LEVTNRSIEEILMEKEKEIVALEDTQDPELERILNMTKEELLEDIRKSIALCDEIMEEIEGRLLRAYHEGKKQLKRKYGI